MGSTEEAQDSQSEKWHQPDQIFHAHHYSLFYPFLWSITVQNNWVAQCPRQPISDHRLCKKTWAQTESPCAIAQDFHKQPPSNSPWGSPCSNFCSQTSCTAPLPLALRPQPAGLVGHNSLLFTGQHKFCCSIWERRGSSHRASHRAKIPGMWQRAAHREVLLEESLIWSHRQDQKHVHRRSMSINCQKKKKKYKIQNTKTTASFYETSSLRKIPFQLSSDIL